MVKKLLLIVSVAAILVSCNSEDYARVQAEVESANQKVEQMNQAQTAKYAPQLTESALTSLKEAKGLAKDNFYLEAEPKLADFHSTADRAIEKSTELRAAEKQASLQKKKSLQPIIYQIKKGDWLSKLARRSNGEYTWNDIYELNRDSIKNPNKIYAGSTLKLPAK